MNTFRKHTITFICALIASLPCTTRSAPMSTNKEVVWHWFSQCSAAKIITIEVSLDSKTVYKSSFSICQTVRGDIRPEPMQRRLIFFPKKTSPSILGEPKSERLEVNIWEAGEDPNDIVLGLSFTTKQRIWLNSLHIVEPDKLSRSVLAKGLVVSTYPAQSNAPRCSSKPL